MYVQVHYVHDLVGTTDPKLRGFLPIACSIPAKHVHKSCAWLRTFIICSFIFLGAAANCTGHSWSKTVPEWQNKPRPTGKVIHQTTSAGTNPSKPNSGSSQNAQTLQVIDLVWIDELTDSNCRSQRRKVSRSREAPTKKRSDVLPDSLIKYQ